MYCCQSDILFHDSALIAVEMSSFVFSTVDSHFSTLQKTNFVMNAEVSHKDTGLRIRISQGPFVCVWSSCVDVFGGVRTSSLIFFDDFESGESDSFECEFRK